MGGVLTQTEQLQAKGSYKVYAHRIIMIYVLYRDADGFVYISGGYWMKNKTIFTMYNWSHRVP